VSLAELQQSSQSRAFLLTIGGVVHRYYSGNVTPTTTAVPGTGGAVNYTDVNAIVEVSNLRASLDPAKGIAAESGVTITLASRGAYQAASDPALHLLRVGVRGATRYRTLATTLAHATGAAVNVVADASLAAWSSSGFFHIGAESFYYGAKAGSEFTTPTRAVAMTRPQAHIVNAAESRTPIITPEVVNWRTRFALLQVANRRPDGSLGTFIDVVRGFVESSPVLDNDGLSVLLTIVPNTALLSMPIGGQVANSTAAATRLVPKYHASDGSVAVSLEVEQRLPRGSWNAHATGTALGAGLVDFAASDVASFQTFFDPTLAAGHPRRGRILRVEKSEIEEIDAVPAGTQLSYADAAEPTPAVVAGETFLNDGNAVDVLVANIHTRGSEAIVKWPDTALTAIATAWLPTAHTGAAGMWGRVKIVAGGERGGALLMKANVNTVVLNRFAAQRLSPFGNTINLFRKAWYPFDMRPDGEEGYVDPTDVFRGNPGWEREEGSNFQDVEWRHVPIRIALGWHQRGEKFLLLEDQIIDVSGGTQHIRATFTEGGEETSVLIPITAVASATDPDTAAAIGFKYTIRESDRLRIPSFGDWPGRARVKFDPVIAFRDENPVTIVLQLLSSGQGVGTNGAYDVLPFGLNLAVSATAATSEVDLASFLATPVPPELAKWSLIITGSEKPADIIGPMLRLLGRALVTKLDQTTGRRIIACAPATLERAIDSVVTLTNGDIIATHRPTSETDDSIFNRYEFTLNHDPITGEAGKPAVVFNDVPSIDEHCETRSLKLECKGLRIAADNPIDALGVLMPAVGSLRAQFAQARRVHEFGLPFSKAVLLDPGQTITWSATDARDSAGALGVTSQAVRVLDVDHGLAREGSKVRVVCHALNGSGWAPAMRVASVTSADIVVVEANYYSDATNPTTGAAQTDVSFFAVGQAVECVPRGNFNARVSVNITVISGNSVTVVGHTLVAGDSIRPEDYDNAATAHQAYGYFGDSAETLGAGGADAKDIV